MTTVMVMGGATGPRRRCDATCHRARKDRCACICGGRYHGIGDTVDVVAKHTEDVKAGMWGEDLAAFVDNAAQEIAPGFRSREG